VHFCIYCFVSVVKSFVFRRSTTKETRFPPQTLNFPAKKFKLRFSPPKIQTRNKQQPSAKVPDKFFFFSYLNSCFRRATRAALPAFFSRKKNYLIRCLNQQNVSFRFCRHNIFSGSLQRPQNQHQQHLHLSIMSRRLQGGWISHNFHFFLLIFFSSSLSRNYLFLPATPHFQLFFSLSFFCHIQLPARIKKKKRKRSESLLGIFLSRAEVERQFCCTPRQTPRPTRETRRPRPIGLRQI